MTSIGGLGEAELLRRILPFLSTTGYEVVAGADDAAVWRSQDEDDGAGYVVASCDTFVEGVHFDLAWMGTADVGRRSVALALGDLAAKGASPTYALVALAVPRTWSVERVVELYRGMSALADRVGMKIAGGDTTAIEGPAVLTLTVLGKTLLVPLARARAEPGWVVAVTGVLGASAVALRARKVLPLDPRLEEGRRLNQAGLCCGDISDGLVREMEKFAAASGCGSVLRAADVPVAPGATLEDALTSGEEVELVCTGPEDIVRGAGLQPLGVMTRKPEVRVVDPQGAEIHLPTTGYDHFA